MVMRLLQYNVENSRKGVIVRCCESTEKRPSLLGERKASRRSLTRRAWRMSRSDPGEGHSRDLRREAVQVQPRLRETARRDMWYGAAFTLDSNAGKARKGRRYREKPGHKELSRLRERLCSIPKGRL